MPSTSSLQAADRCDYRRGFRQGSIFYADSTVSAYAIKQTGDTLETLGEDAGGVPEAVAIKKGDTKTAEAVQKASRS